MRTLGRCLPRAPPCSQSSRHSADIKGDSIVMTRFCVLSIRERQIASIILKWPYLRGVSVMSE